VNHTITRLKRSDFTPVIYDLKNIAYLMNSAYDDAWECTFIYNLTNDYLAVAKILGHSIKGLSKTLGGSQVYESTISQYIHVQPDKEKSAISAYHAAVQQEQNRQMQNQKIIVGHRFGN
jgi:hypothetical protein